MLTLWGSGKNETANLKFLDLILRLMDNTKKKIIKKKCIILLFDKNIANSKDKQQSQWSKKVKESLVDVSKRCFEHEKTMNLNFREFYDKEVKKILD